MNFSIFRLVGDDLLLYRPAILQHLGGELSRFLQWAALLFLICSIPGAYGFCSVMERPANSGYIQVSWNTDTIVDGSTIPSPQNGTAFGNQDVCQSYVERTFTIRNNHASEPLSIQNVSFQNGSSSDFSFIGFPNTNQTINPGGSIPLTIRFDPSSAGIKVATVRVLNGSRNATNFNFAISGVGIADNVLPTISCPSNITTACDPNLCSAVISYTPPPGNDNCPGFSTSRVSGIISGQPVQAGVYPTIWKVTDAAGNTSTCTFTVAVIDNQIPTAFCRNSTISIGPNSHISFTPDSINNNSSDNCSISSASVSPSSFTCSDIGTTQTVTLTVTDASGNTATCSGSVTLVDYYPPTPQCQNATVQLPPNGPVTITASMLENGSFDNCGSPVPSIPPTSLSCSNLGTNTVIVTVTDGSGNTSTCTATVILADVTPPVANCGSTTVSLNAQGSGTLSPQDVDNGSTDNCGIDSLSVSQTTFTCANVGQQTVELTIRDASGNSSSCYATVQVQSQILSANVVPSTKTCNTYHISCRGGSDGVANATASSSCPGLAFYWSNGQIGPTATGLQAGTYSVTITDIPSGDTVIRSVTLLEPPTSIAVSANQTAFYCLEDSNGAAAASATGGTICSPQLYTYHWSTGTNTATVQNTPPGTYSVTATDAQGCTATQTIMIVSSPVPVPTFTNNGSYLSSNQGWSTYQWYLNGNAINGAVNAVLNNPVMGGTYVLHVTDANGCQGESGPMIITRLEDERSHGIAVYPNPNQTGRLFLSSEKPVLSPVDILILDIQGRVLVSQHLTDWVEPVWMDVSNLARGSYLIEAIGDEIHLVRRWVLD